MSDDLIRLEDVSAPLDRARLALLEAYSMMERNWLAKEAATPPAPPKPMSAEEKVDRLIAEAREMGFDFYRFRPAVMDIVREAESAAWDRAIDAAMPKIYSLECWSDSAKTATSIHYENVKAIKGQCHEVQP